MKLSKSRKISFRCWLGSIKNNAGL